MDLKVINSLEDDSVAEQGRDSSSSLNKMLSVLDLFTPQHAVWNTNEIIDALNCSRSTGYRYIKALHSSGLLSTVGNGCYVLGARIIEMDLQIRETDPLLLASKGVLEELVETIGHSALLCTVFKDSVLCIKEHRAPLSPKNRFLRGQRRSLFQGATSKVILAHLPYHRLKAIFSKYQPEIANANLGNNWDEFRSGLTQIKKEGFILTKGEFNPSVYGISAPILNETDNVIGSIGMAWDERERQDVDFKLAALSVKRAALQITRRLVSAEQDSKN